MQDSIKTSIIIPIYNTKEYLEQCINSVLNQTQKEIEIILVDDGSTDGSNYIIKEYEEKYPFVKAIYQENQKLGAARNAGVRAASGKYIYFLDSDDYIHEDLLEECFRLAEKEHLDFVMFDAETFIDGAAEAFRAESTKENFDRSNVGIDERAYSGVEFWDKYFSQGGVFSCAYLMYMNTDFFRENNLYFEPGIYYEDMDWIVRMYLCAERIFYMPKQFYYRRFRSNSIMTAEYNDIHLKSCICLCKKMLKMYAGKQEASMQRVAEPILLIMLRRFNEIFEIYCKEAKLESIWHDTWRFYQALLMDLGSKVEDVRIQSSILLIADRMKSEFQKYDMVSEVSGSILEEYKRQVIFREIHLFPLGNKGKSVGIYGTGVMCDRFFSLYEKYVGEISASIFFIDTYKQSGESCHGRPLYNIKDIVGMDIDSIIITSSRYEEEMRSNIRAYCSEKTEVLVVPRSVNILYQSVI